MKLTHEEQYAILFLSALSVQRGRLLSLQEVSNEFNIPYYFLKKIARSLKDARLVKSKEGAAGGYTLSLPTHEITLADIVEALRGPIKIVEKQKHEPSFYNGNATFEQLNTSIKEVFRQTTLSDFIKK